MADMGDYADRIRGIMQEAQNDLLDFEIICDSEHRVHHLAIIDGMDEEIIW